LHKAGAKKDPQKYKLCDPSRLRWDNKIFISDVDILLVDTKGKQAIASMGLRFES
jgi:hypothetical protein